MVSVDVCVVYFLLVGRGVFVVGWGGGEGDGGVGGDVVVGVGGD